MIRFYFDVLRGSHIGKDLEGTELLGLKEAKAMAEVTVRELLADAIRSGSQHLVEIVAISDGSGRKLAEISARDVLRDALK